MYVAIGSQLGSPTPPAQRPSQPAADSSEQPGRLSPTHRMPNQWTPPSGTYNPPRTSRSAYDSDALSSFGFNPMSSGSQLYTVDDHDRNSADDFASYTPYHLPPGAPHVPAHDYARTTIKPPSVHASMAVAVDPMNRVLRQPPINVHYGNLG